MRSKLFAAKGKFPGTDWGLTSMESFECYEGEFNIYKFLKLQTNVKVELKIRIEHDHENSLKLSRVTSFLVHNIATFTEHAYNRTYKIKALFSKR